MSFATYSLETETQLLLGGVEFSEARQFLAAMPTVQQLMPPLSLDDLGVTRWQPPEDTAAQLTTAMSATDRRRRQIRRAIQTTPRRRPRDRRDRRLRRQDDRLVPPGGEVGESVGNSHPSQRQQDSRVNAFLPSKSGLSDEI